MDGGRGKLTRDELKRFAFEAGRMLFRLAATFALYFPINALERDTVDHAPQRKSYNVWDSYN